MPAELKPGISVIIPVYNSARTLEALLDRVSAALQATGRPHEIVLVNDGSSDDSWQEIVEQAERRSAVRGIRLMRNYGQHNALLCGVRAARLATCVTMDDDLQNPPERIADLLVEIDRGHDVVYGVSARKQHSWGHVVAAKVLRLALTSALGARTAKIASPFRAFRTRLRDAFAHCHSPWVVLDVYLTWATSDFVAVEVPHDRRQHGKVSYTVTGRFALAMDMITGFSTLPLKLASVVGFLFTLFGAAVLVFVVAVWIGSSGANVPGFAFLASTIALFSGAQLFALGILGEYLARMFHRVMDRPPYAVDGTTDGSGDPGGSVARR